MDICLELTGLIGLLIDKYQLKISSTIDKLTGTLTRKALEDTVTGLIESSSKSGNCFSILMFDLDHFKNINDRFGHQMGDTALKRVCEIAMENIRTEDICGRYGGEEFIIALPDVDNDEAYNIAEKIRIRIEEDKILGEKYPVTISIGISLFPQHGQWKQELIEKADQALYVAKELGRNRSQIWNSEFSNHKKSTNKLSGIITGNVVQDSRNVLVIADLIELIKTNISFENKIFNALGRIIEITEAQNGVFFLIKDDMVVEKYGRRIFVDEWTDVKNFNVDIVDSVISKKQGLYMIDWDEIAGYDSITGIPDWHSIIAVPVIITDIVKGVLYLTVSTKIKEFKFDDFNFVGTLGELIAAMI
jgi:diguanylate cyclase (GGDEF)-like protein